jgi:hypothetical protein
MAGTTGNLPPEHGHLAHIEYDRRVIPPGDEPGHATGKDLMRRTLYQRGSSTGLHPRSLYVYPKS